MEKREIVFRGKRIDTGEWIYGFLFIRQGLTYYIQSDNFMLQVIPDTVGQYTGLKDKNGIKIYQGDILKCIEPNANEEFISSFEINPINGIFFNNDSLRLELCLYDYGMPKEIEIIGNIHDNS